MNADETSSDVDVGSSESPERFWTGQNRGTTGELLRADERRKTTSKSFRTDERGVSIPLTHALTFGITAVLVLALLTSAGSFLTAQEERVGENQVSDIGSDVASHINSFDRLNQSGENVAVSIEPNYPDRVLGETYTIAIGDDEQGVYDGVDYTVQIESNLLDRTLYYPLRTSTDLDEGASASSTSPLICLQDNEITMGDACE